jgi:seryl-tRNA synthetase
MLDIKLIRQNPELLDQSLIKRGAAALASKILELDQAYRESLNKTQILQAEKNRLAKEFGLLKREGKDTEDNIKASSQIGQELLENEKQSLIYEKELKAILDVTPNIIADDVPVGKDERDNVVIRKVGDPKSFSFPAKQHFELGEDLNLLDFERASKLSGARFSVLFGLLSKLERAIARFMIDCHTKEFGYTEAFVPHLVLEKTVYGAGQLPKFKEDLFKTEQGHYLISTAEVALTGLVGDEILAEPKLPLRFCAYTPCYRSEAGSAGKDTRGMIRQHQFSKVELVSITTPEHMDAEHERMTSAAENILKKLDLPYRVVLLCSGDMGFQSQKTYDLEVWLPGQHAYREISSCSKCGDFQTRRLNARYKANDGKNYFLSSLNGSGLAVGRTLVAILENYQQEDGSIRIPDVLVPYMDGLTLIQKNDNLFK